MKHIYQQIRILFSWNNGLFKQLSFSILEASIVLVMSQIPFIVLFINYIIENKTASFSFSTIIFVIENNVKSGEVLIYIAGILSSTAVYFLVRIGYLKMFPLMYIICTLGPIILIFFATPVFMADRYGKVINTEFLRGYAIALLIISFCVWLFALYSQRRITEIPLASGDRGARKIIDDVTKEQ